MYIVAISFHKHQTVVIEKSCCCNFKFLFGRPVTIPGTVGLITIVILVLQALMTNFTTLKIFFGNNGHINRFVWSRSTLFGHYIHTIAGLGK